MKIAVLNFSGDVGKTFVTNCLVAPRIPGSCRLLVEAMNVNECVEMSADRAIEHISRADFDLVVDIGVGSVEAVISKLKSLPNSGTVINHFILPTTPSLARQLDTIQAALALEKIGVKPTQIHVVMNKVIDAGLTESDFASVYSSSPEHFNLCQIPILENELGGRMLAENLDEVWSALNISQ